MATNFYFQEGNTSGTTNEQRLVEDLIIESLKIYGHDIYYLPRTSVNPDKLLGEDVLAQFTQAYPIEMYLSNVQGWEGGGEILSKFGIQLTHQATFVVAKRRWEEAVALMTDNLQLPTRPAEGDLLYFSRTKAFFEIKFVDHLDPFFQLGKFYVYSLQCEMYQYGSEHVVTGVEEIDSRAQASSLNLFDHQIALQNGGNLLLQSGFSLIKATTTGTPPDSTFSDNAKFETEGRDILDFGIRNPFGEIL